MTPNIYLSFPGTAEAALDFYAQVFGTTVTHTQRMGQLPDMAAPPGTENLIMHARAQIGSLTLMVSDHVETFSGPYKGFSGFNLQVSVDTVAEAEALFPKLSEGGEVTMALAPTFWAKAFGMCTDRFGVPWMINCDL